MDRIAELGADIARSHDTDLSDIFHDLTGARIETKSAKLAEPAGDLDTIAAEIERQGKALEAKQAADSRVQTVLAGRQKLLDLRLKRLEEERAVAAEVDQQKKSRRGVDPVTEEKQRKHDEATNRAEELEKQLAELQAKNRELSVKLARPAGYGSGADRGKPGSFSSKSAAFAKWRGAQEHYLKTGSEMYQGEHIRALELKALNTQSSADGGYLIHPEYEQGPIEKLLLNVVPMRRLATVRPVSTMLFKKPFSERGTGGGWVGESAARPETTTPVLTELEFPTRELYAMPAASQGMLDDMPDMEGWLAEEVQDKFAELEGLAWVAGSGVNEPRGFLSYDKVENASWVNKKIGYVATGANGAFHATLPADVFYDVTYGCKPQVRSNGAWMMNRRTEAAVRKIKDTTGQYLWQQNLQLGSPPQLCGYPTNEVEEMPNIAADSYSVAFGDWKRGYLITDRIGVRVLRDPFSSKPHVLFYTTKRVGGGVQNFEAIKLVKFAA